MNITGRIHSFESFGTLDGPGIRFVAFMQGCPLHCLYCHNRDTWDPCGGTEYTVDEVIQKMNKFLPYIKASGGGITLSGGEPTLQPEFCTEVFKRCREKQVHTALDTSGLADPPAVSELLDFTDLILLDIKHACNSGHIKVTGAENTKSREFAAYTVKKRIPVWIRYVLVPGLTDSEEALEKASILINEMNNVEKVEVLPYHSMGVYKWQELGLPYPLAGTPSPSEEQLEKALQRLTPSRLHK